MSTPFPPAPPPAAGPPNDSDSSDSSDSDEESTKQQRTFDRFWVDRGSLMHAAGYKKVYNVLLKKAERKTKVKSTVQSILRDMGPPEGSIFDPAVVWEKEKERRRVDGAAEVEAGKKAASEAKEAAKNKKKDKKVKEPKLSKKDAIIAKNNEAKAKKSHDKDEQKMSNNTTLASLQRAKVDTDIGRLQRMLKMLEIAGNNLKAGKENASEEELFDILWALEEMESFKVACEEVKLKKADKNFKMSSAGNTYKEYKDAVKDARKKLDKTKDVVSYQMTRMSDRLPPLSIYNRSFKLEDWQCEVLEAVDRAESAIVCAPTSSGKTLLSTYTCTKAKTMYVDGSKGMVLFVLPTEVLVWQVAATYYQFFKGNVTICTDLIQFQDREGQPQVYIGTPLALEMALTKARGCAGAEMMKGAKEFTILDGGFKFDYMVLDEVHSLNGPEGDALQRIIMATRCPILALSATIGNAQQLRDWFQSVQSEHIKQVKIIEGDKAFERPEEIKVHEVFARFINLQRYVVTEYNVKVDTKLRYELTKLHPMAAMTRARFADADVKELIMALSMTPVDMMDLWDKLVEAFPDEVKKEDYPESFFCGGKEAVLSHVEKRITLPQTKKFEERLKEILGKVAEKHPEKFDALQMSFAPPSDLKKVNSLDIKDQLYGVIEQLKQKELLPAIAFQLSTVGAFQMFTTLLASLETAQNERYPNHRKELIELAKEKALMRKIAAGKAEKRNDKEEEENAQEGFEETDTGAEDIFKPHPAFVLSPQNARLETREIDALIEDLKKAKEPLDANHALIRGLRRGIAIYTNEVGFSCYRRQVQILAQKGKLAVVFSDEALAYGVNMPFRSCVFCGDMGDALTPLIAQQMQGRAGRRGMDVQGNIVYLGMDWPVIENLMLGQISQVTGKNPHYPTMALQGAIAAANNVEKFGTMLKIYKDTIKEYNDHGFSDKLHALHHEFEQSTKFFQFKTQTKTGEWELTRFGVTTTKNAKYQQRVPTLDELGSKSMMGPTLGNYCNTHDPVEGGYQAMSERVCIGLGLVDSNMVLLQDHNVVSMVWECGVRFLPEAINLYGLLPYLHKTFVVDQKRSPEQEGDQNALMSCVLRVIDRVPCREGDQPLQELLKADVATTAQLLDDAQKEMYIEVEGNIRDFQEAIDGLEAPEEERKKMGVPLNPLEYLEGKSEQGSQYGPSLDAAIYKIFSTKQKEFPADVGPSRRNELKERLFKVGEILRVVQNNLQQPHGEYTRLAMYFNKCFSAVMYGVKDMANELTDKQDLCDV